MKLTLATALAFLLATVPLASEAQQLGKVYRVGFIYHGNAASTAPFFEEFRAALRDFGWVDGRDVAFEHRWAEGQSDRFPDLAATLVHLKVDVIVAPVPLAAQAARNATAMIPIVVMFGDPVQAELTVGLARPAANVTGLTSGENVAFHGKRLQLLKETVPAVSRAAVLWDRGTQTARTLSEIELVARSLGLELQSEPVAGPDDLWGAFTRMARTRVGALLVLPSGMFLIHRARISDLAARHRLPAIYPAAEYAAVGGLMSYAPSYRGLYRAAARYVDRLLRGHKPADLPMEQPTKFELVINLKSAKALALTISPSLLLRADRTIE